MELVLCLSQKNKEFKKQKKVEIINVSIVVVWKRLRKKLKTLINNFGKKTIHCQKIKKLRKIQKKVKKQNN